MDILRCKEVIAFFAITDDKFRYVFQQLSAIEEMVEILKAVYELSQTVQKRDIPLADFYRSWIVIGMKLQKHEKKIRKKTQLADELLKAAETREKSIRTTAMLCSI